MKGKVVGRVDGFFAVAAPQRNNAHGGRLVFHYADLDGRRMRSQQARFPKIECVVQVACWMICRRIECIKIMVFVFDFWAVRQVESHASKYVA